MKSCPECREEMEPLELSEGVSCSHCGFIEMGVESGKRLIREVEGAIQNKNLDRGVAILMEVMSRRKAA